MAVIVKGASGGGGINIKNGYEHLVLTENDVNSGDFVNVNLDVKNFEFKDMSEPVNPFAERLTQLTSNKFANIQFSNDTRLLTVVIIDVTDDGAVTIGTKTAVFPGAKSDTYAYIIAIDDSHLLCYYKQAAFVQEGYFTILGVNGNNLTIISTLTVDDHYFSYLSCKENLIYTIQGRYIDSTTARVYEITSSYEIVQRGVDTAIKNARCLPLGRRRFINHGRDQNILISEIEKDFAISMYPSSINFMSDEGVVSENNIVAFYDGSQECCIVDASKNHIIKLTQQTIPLELGHGNTYLVDLWVGGIVIWLETKNLLMKFYSLQDKPSSPPYISTYTDRNPYYKLFRLNYNTYVGFSGDKLLMIHKPLFITKEIKANGIALKSVSAGQQVKIKTTI